ncbi:TRAP transporter small permease subunit [Desulfotignum phosphitoxidans]|uniref:TRAP-type C4-dicarboxylate transporter permease, small subunit DctQ n=1 Tax=Desulfotignum phosphitoxidans DSM 13687 TaxID=1286635 RepID=S0G2Q6_9BACT|nr:TRAP transporter small permease subunit [Desulfotignum phosphitoxidans]EMS81638.1 TRAP-type C4-dicarboxylate transporter permease, small subunit DctQ [Desulfotignum phosphitoxidans DSM 13687]
MLEPLYQNLENIVRKQGDVTSFLVYPLLIIVVYEVFMRYVFNAPTTWGFEATTFLYGLHYMFGLSYADVHGAHVKVDIFTSLVSKKSQAVLSIITNLVFFMPVTICLTLWGIKYAYTATKGLEVNPTSWAPPIWPLKILMALCLVFLLIQGIANLLKDINILKQQGRKVLP